MQPAKAHASRRHQSSRKPRDDSEPSTVKARPGPPRVASVRVSAQRPPPHVRAGQCEGIHRQLRYRHGQTTGQRETPVYSRAAVPPFRQTNPTPRCAAKNIAKSFGRPWLDRWPLELRDAPQATDVPEGNSCSEPPSGALRVRQVRARAEQRAHDPPERVLRLRVVLPLPDDIWPGDEPRIRMCASVAAIGGKPAKARHPATTGTRLPARRRRRGNQSRCTIVLMPWPMPMHMVATPNSASFAPSCQQRRVMRAPEQPSGWPSAIAPPLRLTFFRAIEEAQILDHRQRLRGEGLVQLADCRCPSCPAFARAAPSASPAPGRSP